MLRSTISIRCLRPARLLARPLGQSQRHFHASPRCHVDGSDIVVNHAIALEPIIALSSYVSYIPAVLIAAAIPHLLRYPFEIRARWKQAELTDQVAPIRHAWSNLAHRIATKGAGRTEVAHPASETLAKSLELKDFELQIAYDVSYRRWLLQMTVPVAHFAWTCSTLFQLSGNNIVSNAVPQNAVSDFFALKVQALASYLQDLNVIAMDAQTLNFAEMASVHSDHLLLTLLVPFAATIFVKLTIFWQSLRLHHLQRLPSWLRGNLFLNNSDLTSMDSKGNQVIPFWLSWLKAKLKPTMNLRLDQSRKARAREMFGVAKWSAAYFYVFGLAYLQFASHANNAQLLYLLGCLTFASVRSGLLSNNIFLLSANPMLENRKWQQLVPEKKKKSSAWNIKWTQSR